MAELEFSYNMKIEFSYPVIKHCFSLRCIPLDNEIQKINSINIDIEPHNILSQTIDSFGNKVLIDRITEQHTKFSVKVEGTASVNLTNQKQEELNSIYKYPSDYTKAGDSLKEFILSIPTNLIETPVKTAENLTKEIHKVFNYKSGVTNINTTAQEAFDLGCGVCQDFSHILISICRYINIPARYVAGIQKGCGETHAWVEVFENGKWVGVDVTNNKLVDDTYLILSHGRDFGDCGINRGLFIGGGTQKQTVNACIKVL